MATKSDVLGMLKPLQQDLDATEKEGIIDAIVSKIPDTELDSVKAILKGMSAETSLDYQEVPGAYELRGAVMAEKGLRQAKRERE